MDDIVRESGLTKGGIYWYFKSKRDIFLALFSKHIMEDSAVWGNYRQKFQDAESLLVDGGALSVREHVHSTWLIPLFQEMAAEATRDRTLRKKTSELLEMGADLLIPMFKDAHASGEIKKADYRHLSIGLLALGYGLTVFHHISEKDVPSEQIWRQITKALFHGIKKKESLA
jgi:AcrR family transcriptional regulator